MQECHPLGHHLCGERIDPGRAAARPREADDKSATPNTIGIVAIAALAANEGLYWRA
jgi:hypothetical protein